MKNLKIKLDQTLRERLEETNKQQFAKEAGISIPTLRSMLNNRWEYIHRASIERVMDYLRLDANQVFESVPATFWDGIKESRHCTLICGSRNGKRGINLPPYTLDAAYLIQSFLKNLGSITADILPDLSEDELLSTVRSKNCIVIGSPKVNQATEILLTRYFKAEPFDPTDDNCRIMPFGFIWGQPTPETEKSSLGCCPEKRARLEGKPGLAWAHGEIKIDFCEPEAFSQWKTARGNDAGLVFVADQPFGTSAPVKLIVLAGVGGIGTMAAASALIQDFRELDPLPMRYVYGMVQGRYTKHSSENDGRTYKSFRWRYRKFGRTPLNKGKSLQKPKRLAAEAGFSL